GDEATRGVDRPGRRFPRRRGAHRARRGGGKGDVPGLPRSRYQGVTFGPRSTRSSVLAALVATLGVLVFVPALTGDFIYDDRTLVADNVHVHSFDDWRRWFTHDFWDVNEEVKHFVSRMMYWRPAVSASYAVDWGLGG